MAKEVKGSKELLKWKKKKWVQIIAPPQLREAVLGESFVVSPESLVGKTIQCNLMTLTGDIKKQHINLKFIIGEIKEGKAQTKLISYTLSNANIKRNVRRKRDKIDCVFKAKTKDEFDIVMKIILITKNNASNSVLTLLRRKTVEIMLKEIAASAFEDVVGDVLEFKSQNELKKQLKVIYPLRSCDVRFLGLDDKVKK